MESNPQAPQDVSDVIQALRKSYTAAEIATRVHASPRSVFRWAAGRKAYWRHADALRQMAAGLSRSERG